MLDNAKYCIFLIITLRLKISDSCDSGKMFKIVMCRGRCFKKISGDLEHRGAKGGVEGGVWGGSRTFLFSFFHFNIMHVFATKC